MVCNPKPACCFPVQVDVSFHGGLSVLPSEITASNIVPYLSAQSGGSDESPVRDVCLWRVIHETVIRTLASGVADWARCPQDEIMWLQDTMSGIGGTKWDITRYSKVGHGFTVWGGGAYHLRADGRSWDAMKVS